METVAEGFAIVIAGAWNSAIFAPAWVAGRLTASQEIGLELTLNNPALAPRLSFDGVLLRVLPDKLVIHPQEISEASLKRMQEVADRILGDLPHTPVQAVGVNFRFNEPKPGGKLLDAFQL